MLHIVFTEYRYWSWEYHIFEKWFWKQRFESKSTQVYYQFCQWLWDFKLDWNLQDASMHERLFTKNEIITFVRVQAWKMITIHQNVKIQQIWTGWIMLKRTTRPISLWCAGCICFLLAQIHVSRAVCFWNVKAVYIKIIILRRVIFIWSKSLYEVLRM